MGVNRKRLGVERKPPSIAVVKERLELYLYPPPLWNFTACYKVTFTFNFIVSALLKMNNFKRIMTPNCFRGSFYVVRLGANRLDVQETGSLTIKSLVTAVHPNYRVSTLRNDIALIRLPLIVSFTSKFSFLDCE